MSAAGAKSASHNASRQEASRPESDMPLSLLCKSELLWWPYRSLANVLLPTCQGTAAFLDIQRKFMDEIRGIIRREQDFVFDQSEKFFRKTAEESGASSGPRALTPASMEEFYESTIQGVRHFTRALADAQVRSLEAFREQSREASRGGTNGSSASSEVG